MGKSEAAKSFAKLGVPVFDSDACVHELFVSDEKLKQDIKINFPDATENNEINRAKLGAIVFNSAEKTKQLEALVHPHVREAQEKFLAKYKNKKAPLVAFDIPLLFETGAEQRLDKTLVISASKQTQQQRVLERGGMTKEKFAAILAMQMDDAEKQKRASFVISSENGIEPMQKEIESLIKQLTT